MSEHQDRAIDALLRKHFEGPVADAGFSDRVMQQLPPRRRVYRWQLPAGILVGLGACAWTVSSTPLIRSGWQDWMHGEFSLSAIVTLLAMAGMSLLVSWWAMAETQ